MRPDPSHRRVMSRFLGGVHLALAAEWIFPLHGGPTPGRLSAVQTLNQFVPIWVPAFGLTGILLLGCSLFRRSMVLAHAVGATVMLVFGAMSTISALPLWGQQLGSFLGATLAFGLCGVHALVQRSYVQVVSR